MPSLPHQISRLSSQKAAAPHPISFPSHPHPHFPYIFNKLPERSISNKECPSSPNTPDISSHILNQIPSQQKSARSPGAYRPVFDLKVCKTGHAGPQPRAEKALRKPESIPKCPTCRVSQLPLGQPPAYDFIPLTASSTCDCKTVFAYPCGWRFTIHLFILAGFSSLHLLILLF